MTLSEIVERLGAATGPDRELDALIHCVANAGCKPQGPPGCFTFNDGKVAWRGWKESPHYTASIDAAMTLVPEGHVWSVQTDFGLPGRAYVYGSVMGKRDMGFQADGATPAAALCIAALKARIYANLCGFRSTCVLLTGSR